MPTYGYRCSDCKNEFEISQKMSDAPLTVCEKCGGTLKKILYPVGIAFKGEGFYVNDNPDRKTTAAKPAADAATAGDAKPAGGDAASATGGETKTTDAPATKSETPASTASTPAAPAAGTTS